MMFLVFVDVVVAALVNTRGALHDYYYSVLYIKTLDTVGDHGCVSRVV